MLPDRTLRASDDDREKTVSRLGDHLAAGRLETAEFEERMSAAYRATTLGDLDVLMTDLPTERPEPSTSVEKPAAAPVGKPQRRFPHYGSWLSVSLITLAVWGISSAAAAEPVRFWPVWVIVPWGLAIVLGMGRRGHGHGHGRPDRDDG